MVIIENRLKNNLYSSLGFRGIALTGSSLVGAAVRVPRVKNKNLLR